MRLRPANRQQAQAKEGENAWSTVRFIVLIAIAAWALRSFVMAPFNIPSGSMLPTLYIGDYLVVAKWPYGYSRYSFPFGFPAFEGRIFEHLPAHGDVVVFRVPSENADLIKRVIGLPGDTIEVRNGQLILNGKAVPRQPLPPYKLRISPNSPCKVVPPATPVAIQGSDGAYCLFRAYLETLPGGPSYTVLDELQNGP